MATPTTLPSTFVAGNVLTAAEMNALRGGFRILQVVSTTKTDTFSSSATTFTAITGLSATITPTAATSKVLVIVNVKGASDNGTANSTLIYRLVRGSTPIGVGDVRGSRRQATGSLNTRSTGSNSILQADTACVLDSPATTSATTYSVEGVTDAGTWYVNRTELDNDSTFHLTSVSSVTLLEVSA